MIIEVGRFPDKRLKVIRKHGKTDSNVRVDEKEVTIVSKIEEVELEKDVIDAIELKNSMDMFPELEREINQLLNRHFPFRYSSIKR
jgi:hypothetical protein